MAWGKVSVSIFKEYKRPNKTQEKVKKMNKQKSKLIVAASAALVAELFAPVFVGTASAAPPVFTQAFVRPDRFKSLTTSALPVCAIPTAATTGLTENQVVLFIPTDSVSTVFALTASKQNW